MPWGKTCFRSRSETASVRLRASTFLVWFHAFRATIAHAAPAASHSNDSTPRALSWGLRTGGSGFVFIMRGLPAAGPLYGSTCHPARVTAMGQFGLIHAET